jgi:hypothetical protein
MFCVIGVDLYISIYIAPCHYRLANLYGMLISSLAAILDWLLYIQRIRSLSQFALAESVLSRKRAIIT